MEHLQIFYLFVYEFNKDGIRLGDFSKKLIISNNKTLIFNSIKSSVRFEEENKLANEIQ
jgi:hypothetical protein